jgi:hypothetical protein
VSDEWLGALTKQCEEEPDLYDKERAAKLSQITGIQVSRQAICDWCWRINITRKRKTTEYADKEKEVNQKRTKKFLEDHHPQTGFISLLNCASTDEFGVECTKDCMYGVSRVRQSREVPGGKSKLEEATVLNPLASLSRKRSISSSNSVVHFQFVWRKSALFLAIKYKIKTSMDKVLPSSSRSVNVVDLSHMAYLTEQLFTVPRHRKNASWKKVWLKCMNKPKFNVTFIRQDFHIGNLLRSASTT